MPGSPTLSSSQPYARPTFACDAAARAVSSSSASNDCSDKLRLFVLWAYQSAFVIAELPEERTKIRAIEDDTAIVNDEPSKFLSWLPMAGRRAAAPRTRPDVAAPGPDGPA